MLLLVLIRLVVWIAAKELPGCPPHLAEALATLFAIETAQQIREQSVVFLTDAMNVAAEGGLLPSTTSNER